MECLQWPVPINHSSSANRSSTMVLFLHVAKTGGTSLVDWAHRRSRGARGQKRSRSRQRGQAPPQPDADDEEPFFDKVVRYGCAPCYLCAYFSQLLPCDAAMACSDPMDVKAAEEAPDAWRRKRVFVEFHAPGTSAFYINLISPRLPPLRDLYLRQERGMALALTLLREPVAHMLSCWRFRPPTCGATRAFPSSTRLCRTFDSWLATASGLQAGALTAMPPPVGDAAINWDEVPWPEVYTTPNPGWYGYNNPRGCSVRAAAEAQLWRFDLLGVTEGLPALIDTLSGRLGIPVRHNATIKVVRPWAAKAENEHSFYYNQSRAVSWDSVGNQTRARWLAAAECDRALYSLARNASGTTASKGTVTLRGSGVSDPLALRRI